MTMMDGLPASYHESARERLADLDGIRSRRAAMDALLGHTFRGVIRSDVRIDIATHIMVRSLHRQAARLGLEGVRYDELHRGISGHDGLGLEDLPSREPTLFD